MIKNRLILAMLCVSLLAPGVNSFASEAVSASEQAQMNQIEESLSEAVTLEKIQSGIDTVRATATADELMVVNSIQAEVDQLKAEVAAAPARKQTKIGKLATRIGLAINRGLISASRPFFYGAGYLSGRYSKKNQLDENGNNRVLNLIAHLANRLKDKGESEAAALADRIVRGDRLNSTELDLLIAAFPKLDVQDWEPFAVGAGMGISIGVGLKILAAAGLGAATAPLFLVTELGLLGSWVPCMIADFSKNPNENTVRYCEQIAEEGYSKILTSRIRGYLRGVQARNARNQ